MNNVQQPQSSARLFPDDLYEDLYDAGLIGEGSVYIYGHFTTTMQPRMNDSDKVWRDTKVVDLDTTLDTMSMVPILDENGRILGDWTQGLSIEQIKRINEEAGVPIYRANDKDHEHGDTPILVHHGMKLDLADPRQMSKFKILYFNDAIALNKKDILEDQDFYFFIPEEEKREKKASFDLRREAINLVNNLGDEAKIEILNIMSYEHGVVIPESASDSDIVMLFEEQCWDKAAQVLTVYKYPFKETRLMLYTLVAHNVIMSTSHSYKGPFHRLSTEAGRDFGELIGENIGEAIKNLGKRENSDLVRKYQSIKSGTIKEEDAVSKLMKTGESKLANLIEQAVLGQVEYQLPDKITKNWINKAKKHALQAYLSKYEIEFQDDETNAQLREKVLPHWEKNNKEE